MSKEAIFPDMVISFLLSYKEEFLRTNRVKVGDSIKVQFYYEILRPKYRGSGSNKYTERKIADGILKEDNQGVLYVESVEDLQYYELKTNGLSGRSRREWYDKVRRKGIKIIGDIRVYHKLDL